MNLKIKLDDKMLFIVILALTSIFSFVFLGFSGFKILVGMIVLMFLPFYLILSCFNISKGERVIFSIFISFGIFPAITYWLGRFISFKISIWITFALLMIVWLLIKRFKK